MSGFTGLTPPAAPSSLSPSETSPSGQIPPVDGPLDGEVLPHPNLAALCAALDEVQAARPAAVQVVSIVDDPNATAQRVADAIERDPALTAQLMRLANSAFYGMCGRVGNTGFAVTVIGFSAVRSLAAVTATGMDRADTPKPPGFWEHAAAAAAGCSAVAPVLGVPTSDAFAAGLLHDLGSALLHRFDRVTHGRLIEQTAGDGGILQRAEADAFGLGHDEAAARVLEAWRFPQPFVDAIAGHHLAARSTSPFAATLVAGDALAHLSQGTSIDGEDPLARVIGVGIDPDRLDDLIETTRTKADEIRASLPAS